MRALLIAAGAVALIPVSASAAAPPLPVVYVCTPDAVVYKIESGSSTKLFNGTGTFNDCTFGYDGNLYILNDLKILRINPQNKETAKNQQAVVGTLAFPGRGLGFNGPAVYVNTTGGIYKLVASGPEPLTFGTPELVSAGNTAEAAGGLVFDVFGNLLFAKGGDVRFLTPSAAPPHYTGSVQTAVDATAAFGVAIDPCRQIVYADTSTKKIKRGGTAPDIDLSPLVPLHMAVDQWGSLYVVAASNVSGQSAKVYRYDFSDFQSCNTTPTRTEILSVNKAIGIAVEPRDVPLSRTFPGNQCLLTIDAGWHKVIYQVDNCSGTLPAFTMNITTRLTKPSDVKFDEPPFDAAATTHFNYSPFGGFAAEIFQSTVGDVSGRGLLSAQYWFFTQDVTTVPGHAREATGNPQLKYNENIPLQNFWDLGFDPGGQTSRGDFGSKHLMVNTSPPGLCQALPQNFEQPLTGLLTPAQGGSVLKIAFNATGQPDCSGGTLVLSVAKISNTPGSCNTVNVSDVETMPVQSAGNAQTGNVMSNNGNRYWFNLDTSGQPVGTYRFTISGDKVQAVGGCYTVGQ